MMARVRDFVVLSLGVALVIASPAGAAQGLFATVKSGSPMSLRSSYGQAVTLLRPGTYSIAISDGSRTQNFHLLGPGTNKKTGIAFVGRITWRLRLSPGLYRYRSDSSRKVQSFRVVRR
jgi:hypothetical protein